MSHVTSQPDVFYIDELKRIDNTETQIGHFQPIHLDGSADQEASMPVLSESGQNKDNREAGYTAMVEQAYQQGENDAVERLSRLLAKRRAMAQCFQACSG